MEDIDENIQGYPTKGEPHKCNLQLSVYKHFFYKEDLENYQKKKKSTTYSVGHSIISLLEAFSIPLFECFFLSLNSKRLVDPNKNPIQVSVRVWSSDWERYDSYKGLYNAKKKAD